MVIEAVIASIGHADETVFPLIGQLLDEGVGVTVVDNKGTFNTDELPQEAGYVWCDGNVYEAWNRGIELAAFEGADWVAILNDDITLAPRACTGVAETLNDRKDVWLAGFDYEYHDQFGLRLAKGSFREHGIGGFGFMLRLSSGLRFDPRFNWWGGDDDLVYTCLFLGGKAVVVEGVHISHPPSGGTSSQHYPELMEGIGEDRALLRSKWGKSW